MKTTIILAHPWDKSYNNAIAQEVRSGLGAKNKEFNFIDLNKDGFNPTLTEEELSVYSDSKYIDPLVEKYQKMLKESDELVIIFPIWWFSMPAILKGFLDKVMSKDFAWKYQDGRLLGGLTQIKMATIITTSDSPKDFITPLSNLQNSLAEGTLKFVGVQNTKWMHLGNVGSIDDEDRKGFLDGIREHFKK